MDRRGFALLGLGSLFGCSCTSKPKEIKKEVVFDGELLTEKENFFLRTQKEVEAALKNKLRQRDWKLEECNANLFCGLPNLKGTKLYWHKTDKGYYFFIKNFKMKNINLAVVEGKKWINEEGLDDETTIHSRTYNISEDEASQLYINLAYVFMVK